MSSLSELFPPGTDLCAIPSGLSPDGTFDFSNTGLRTLTISFSVILTTFAVLIGVGRLYANFRRYTWSDLLVLLTILCNIADAALMIVFVKTFRHMWNIPLCWIDGQYLLASYLWEVLNSISLFCAKTATFLLFLQLFTVSRPMRIAIWIGITVGFLMYGLTLGIMSYYGTPHVGHTWDELVVESIGTTIFPLKWAVGQGVINTLYDIYIFVLPLPVIYRLNLSRKRKAQVFGVFFVGLLGVLASTVSLVYRVKSIQGPHPDGTYNAGVLMICNLLEMNVALVICSATAFAGFMRVHVIHSRAFQALRSTLLGSLSAKSTSNLMNSAPNPNKPRTGRDDGPNKRGGKLRGGDNYIEMGDTWLLNSGATVDVEAQHKNAAQIHGHQRGLMVHRAVDVERESIPSSRS